MSLTLPSDSPTEEASLLRPGMEYPVWSPYDAREAADTMLKVLKAAEPNHPSERVVGKLGTQ